MKLGTKLLIFFIISYAYSNAQSTIAFDFFPVGLHFDRTNFLIFENKIDYNGNAVIEPGGCLTYEFFIKETINSIQIQQGLFFDAAAQVSGWSQISFRKKIFHKYKHKLSLAAGPALTYRRDWYKIDGYQPEPSYMENGNWEFRWAIPIQLQYSLYTSSKTEFLASLLYHYERHTIFPTIGFKYWISTKVRFQKDCNCNDAFRKRKFRDFFR